MINPEPLRYELHPPRQTAQSSLEKSGTPLRRALILVLALVLVSVALLVVVELPGRVESASQSLTLPEKNSTPMTKAQSSLPPSVSEPSITPENIAQQQAEKGLQNFLRQRAQPDLQHIEKWASEQWLYASDLAEQGDQFYGRRRFKEAATAYEDALKQLQDLRNERPQILLDTLALARDQLKNKAIAPAIEAYERVLLMQPEHAQAQQEYARANVRSAVLSLIEEGRKANSLNDAKSAYHAALKLDPTYRPAQLALQAIIEEQNSLAYQQAMSQALNYLQAENFKATRDALKIAMQLRPDTPEVKDARQRLLDAQRQSSLNRLRQEATQFATQEKWTKAASRYKEALGIDPQATFARGGLEHAESRLALHSQLDHYLNTAQRLSSDEPLDNARKLLAANARIPQGEPALATKIKSLKTSIDLAMRTVELIIKSDTLTDVTIYHVGRMGRFSSKQIELRPGVYTVTGSCTGYRDVRKVITLEPGIPTTTIQIRCEEAI